MRLEGRVRPSAWWPLTLAALVGCAGRREEQLGRGARAREGAEGVAGEEQPLLETDTGDGPGDEEELGTPAQRPEPMDGNG